MGKKKKKGDSVRKEFSSLRRRKTKIEEGGSLDPGQDLANLLFFSLWIPTMLMGWFYPQIAGLATSLLFWPVCKKPNYISSRI